MSEQTDEQLFDRMRAVLDARCAAQNPKGEFFPWRRFVWITHRRGWEAGVGVSFGEEARDNEEVVAGKRTASAALRALADAVLATRNPSPPRMADAACSAMAYGTMLT